MTRESRVQKARHSPFESPSSSSGPGVEPWYLPGVGRKGRVSSAIVPSASLHLWLSWTAAHGDADFSYRTGAVLSRACGTAFVQGCGHCEAAEASWSAGGTIASSKEAEKGWPLRTSARLCGSRSTWGGRPGCLFVRQANERSTSSMHPSFSTFQEQLLCTMVLSQNSVKLVKITGRRANITFVIGVGSGCDPQRGCQALWASLADAWTCVKTALDGNVGF